MRFVEKQPPTSWNVANPQEYGFYSNVNPDVDHPRWSQGRERRIGEFAKRRTLMRSEEHTSELQSLMRISYAVFCLKKKIKPPIINNNTNVKFNVSNHINVTISSIQMPIVHRH